MSDRRFYTMAALTFLRLAREAHRQGRTDDAWWLLERAARRWAKR